MLQYLLAKTPTTKPRHLRIYLRLASRRYDAGEALPLLLEHFHGIASSRGDFARSQLLSTAQVMLGKRDSVGSVDLRSVLEDNRSIFDAVLRWMDRTCEIVLEERKQRGSQDARNETEEGTYKPAKSFRYLRVIEDLFWTLNSRKPKKAYSWEPKPQDSVPDLRIPHMPFPSRTPPQSTRSTAYIFGRYYTHRLRTRLVRRCTAWLPVSCPCPQKPRYRSHDQYCWCDWMGAHAAGVITAI